jgi:2-oxoglutarate ferredoxin oxidoreductase subunit alpha
MKELRLMKGNEAIAEAAIRCGVDAYYGYPITPQSEVMEYLMAEEPHNRTGMVVLQAESEVASINMVYGAAAGGKMAMTSSSSPGISLMVEGISYAAGSELPCLIVNVQRGGPGLGTIQPGQADYFQATKGGGHGDYRLIVFAPASVQEMADFVELAFDLAFKYRNPAMILSDGAIGQMMEKVYLPEQKQRLTNEEIEKRYGSWATIGKRKDKERNIITSLALQSEVQEKHNFKLQAKYKTIEENEVRFEKIDCDDADYLFVAYGTSARICQKAVKMSREKGIKAGLFRPITLWPFPSKEIKKLAGNLKGILSVEMSAGQMIEDVKLAVEGKVNVEHYGRFGGMIPSPNEVLNALEEKLINK